MWTFQNVKCEPPNHAFTYQGVKRLKVFLEEEN